MELAQQRARLTGQLMSVDPLQSPNARERASSDNMGVDLAFDHESIENVIENAREVLDRAEEPPELEDQAASSSSDMDVELAAMLGEE